MKKFLAIAAALLLAFPAQAANRKPVVYNNGYQSLQVGDTLVNPSGVAYAPATSGSSLLYGNGAGGFSNATVGTGLSFVAGLLVNTGAGGSAFWTVNPFCSTAGGANPCLKYGSGAPAASADPVGSLYFETDIADLYQQVIPTTITLSVVQSASVAATTSVVLGAAPTSGDLLVAVCSGYTSAPGANTGWTSAGATAPNVFTPGDILLYKQAQAGESATQIPCTGGARPTVTLWEIAGAPQWAQVFEASSVSTGTVSVTTAHNNDLVLGAAMAQQVSADPGAPPITGGLTSHTASAHAATAGVSSATDGFSSSGTGVNFTWTPVGQGSLARVIVLKPPTQGWQKMSRLARFQDSSGTDFSIEPMVFRCGSHLTCSASASPYGVGDLINVDSSAAPTAANPTATASDTAVNGSAATFMRSDAAPAVQKTSSSVFGLAKVDGTTITAASGVISANVTGAAIHGTPTAGNCTSWFSATAVQDAGAACGGGGGTTNNYYAGALTLISTQTLTGSSNVASFTSIPSGYTDLVIIGQGRSASAGTGSDTVLLTFNSDTAANYAQQFTTSNASTASAVQLTGISNIRIGELPKAGTLANSSGAFVTEIPSYTGTTYSKNVLSSYSVLNNTTTASLFNNSITGIWNATPAAVTRIDLTTPGNWTGVVSLYGRGGSNVAALPTTLPPQGRLTLTSGTPVMTADATAQTTIYYAPYQGNLLPIGGVSYSFSQISYALNTTAHASSSLYDVFAYNASGTPALCTGPAWTNSTTRAAAISMTNGLWFNSATLTCNLTGGTTTTSLAAGAATYLGTFYATAAGQTGMAFRPAAASGGTNNILGLYNAYNRVDITAICPDNGVAYGYSTATVRAARGSTANRISYVDGLQQSAVKTTAVASFYNSGAAGELQIGTSLDSTSSQPTVTAPQGNNASTPIFLNGASIPDLFMPQLGFHFLQRTEEAVAGTPNVNPTAYLLAELMM